MKPNKPTLADARRMLQPRGARIPGLVVSWASRPTWMTYPTGAQGWDSRVAVAAPGYRGRTMILTRDAHGTGIR